MRAEIRRSVNAWRVKEDGGRGGTGGNYIAHKEAAMTIGKGLATFAMAIIVMGAYASSDASANCGWCDEQTQWGCTYPREHWFHSGGDEFRNNSHSEPVCSECPYHGHAWCSPEGPQMAHDAARAAAARGAGLDVIIQEGGEYARLADSRQAIDLINCAGEVVDQIRVDE